MSRDRRSWFLTTVAMVAVCLAVASAASAQTTYTWAPGIFNHNWNDPNVWFVGDANLAVYGGPPHVSGDVAVFSANGVAFGVDPNDTTRAGIYANPANAYTVSLNNQAFTMGGLQALGTNSVLTIADGGASGLLVFKDPNGLSYLNVATSNTWLRVNTAVRLDNDLYINTLTGTDAENMTPIESTIFSKTISGTGKMTIYSSAFTSGGTVVLQGNNTFSGGIDISYRGWVMLNGAHAAGTGPIYAGFYMDGNLNNTNSGQRPVLTLAADNEANAIYGNDLYGTPYMITGNAAGVHALMPGNWSYRMGNWYPDKDAHPVVFWGKNEGENGFADSNYSDHPVAFKSTTLYGGQLLRIGFSYGSFNLGKITGSGNIQMGAGTWADYAETMVMDDPNTDFGGTITNTVDGEIVLMGPHAQGNAHIVLSGTNQYNGGAALISCATSNAQANHSDLTVTIGSAGIIDGRQNGAMMFYAPVINDPNVITHRFGGVTFSQSGGALQVGGRGDTSDKFIIVGTVLLNGNSSVAPGNDTTFAGLVTGGNLVVSGGGATLWMTNTTNDYVDTTLTGGTLGVTAVGQLGTGTVFINGGVLQTYTGNLGLSNPIVFQGSGRITSFANDDANANHSTTSIAMVGDGTLIAQIGWAPNGDRFDTISRYSLPNADPNLAADANFNVTGYAVDANFSARTHKFNELTFASSRTLTTGAFAANSSSIEFVGTTTLAGSDTFNLGQRVILSGKVTGGNLILAGGNLLMTNTANDYGDTTLSGGALGVTAAGELGAGTVFMNGGTLNTYTGNLGTPLGIVALAAGGRINSIASTDANADHSSTNLELAGNLSIIGFVNYSASGNHFDGAGDPNFARVTHKFGGLTFDGSGLTLSTGDWDTDYARIEFVGTVTLNGTSNFSTYRESVILSGQVTGTGSVHAVTANGGAAVWLTNNLNNYTDGTTIESDARVVVAAPNALGVGNVFLNGGVLYSVANDDATANHSLNSIVLQPAGGNVFGIRGFDAAGNAFDGSTDANFTAMVTHKFGGLTFTTTGQTFMTGGWPFNNDTIQITGTTTLFGDSTVFAYSPAILSGKVTDGNSTGGAPGNLIIPANWTAHVLWLTNNTNDYGDTHLNGNPLVITGGHTLGNGVLFLNAAAGGVNGVDGGAALFSLATNNAEGNRSYVNVVLQGAGGSILGGHGINPATGNLFDGGADPNFVVRHVFGNLTFTSSGQIFDTFAWPASNDIIRIAGTTTLVGNSRFQPWEVIELAGKVTGDGTLVAAYRNTGNPVILMNNQNDFTGGILLLGADTAPWNGGVVRALSGSLGSGPIMFGVETGMSQGGNFQDWSDGNFANHSSTNLELLIGRTVAPLYVANSDGTSGTGAGTVHTFGNLTFDDTVAQTILFGGLRPDMIVIAGTTTLNGRDAVGNTGGGPGPMIVMGQITGSGAFLQQGFAQGDGGTNTGGLVLTSSASDYSGGTWVYGRMAVTDANQMGTGGVFFAGGTLNSVATNNAQANHSAYSYVVLASSTIYPEQGWTGNNLNNHTQWADPNFFFVHKFGDVTFTTTSTLTASSTTYNRVQFMGTVTLAAGRGTFSGGTLTLLSNEVTGPGDLGVSGGLVVLGSATNTYGATFITGGNLGVTSGNPGNGNIVMSGGTLTSIATDNLNANHSLTNITVQGNVTFRAADGIAPGLYHTTTNVLMNADPASVIHKWGGVTFTTAATVSVSADLNDMISFEGTTTLAGALTLTGGYYNGGYNWDNPLYNDANLGGTIYNFGAYVTRFNGPITGTGDINYVNGGATWTAGPVFWLGGNNDTTGNTTVSTNGGRSWGGLVISAPHALGSGTLFLNGSTLYSLAQNDANANHSYLPVVVASAAYTYGSPDTAGAIVPPESAGTRPGLVGIRDMSATTAYSVTAPYVTHKFGDLFFAGVGYTLFVGDYDTAGDNIEFVGTTHLDAREYFVAYREQITLAGLVTGAGQLVTRNANAGNGIWLLNNANDYAGGTEIQGAGGYLVAMAQHALSTGPVLLNGGTLYSQGLDDANVDRSATNVTVSALGGQIVGAKIVIPALTQSRASAGSRYTATVPDPNFAALVTHKFGNLSFATTGSGITFGSRDYQNVNGAFLTDIVEFVGSTTLNGNTTLQADQPTILAGLVTGDPVNGGNLIVNASASGQRYLAITGNGNSYGDTTIQGSGNLRISAPQALGIGTVFMNGGSLSSLADNDANANHSYAPVVVRANSTMNAYKSGFATGGPVVTHQFGDLTMFAGFTLTVGNQGATNDVVKFAGTTTLNGTNGFVLGQNVVLNNLAAGAATLNLSNIDSNTGLNWGLSVNAITQDTVNVGKNTTLTVRNGVAKTTSVINTLAIAGGSVAPTGTVDIGKNFLVVTAPGQLNAVNSMIASGANFNNTQAFGWDGKGITSSLAAADSTNKLAVGVGNADDEGFTGSLFGDHLCAATDTLVMLTLSGDTDLTGNVDIFDYNTLKTFFGTTSGATWEMGDFDYNGTVDIFDYNTLKTFFGQSLPSAPALVVAPGAVPEPATLVLLGLGAVALLKRRNNKV